MRRPPTRAAACLLLVLSGCCCETGPAKVVRAPLETAAAARTDPPALRALVFGDFGQATCQREAVTAAMEREHHAAPFDVAIVAGDNVYACGPDLALPGAGDCRFLADGASVDPTYRPPHDPRFDLQHEWALTWLARPDGSPVPTWLALGNHDVRSDARCSDPDLAEGEIARTRACLEVAHESAHWRMPGRHYLVDASAACFVFVDSNTFLGPYGDGFDRDAESAFLASTVPACGGRPTFLVGHHPPATVGTMVLRQPYFQASVERLLTAGGGSVSAWLGGHDHDLQHLRILRGLDVFVSGNTCDGTPYLGSPSIDGTLELFASNAWGFAVLSVWDDGGWGMRFVATGGDPLHCCESAGPAGPCESIACE